MMGLPDVLMRRADLDPDGDTIIEVIRYMCQGDKTIGDGHLLADENSLCFQTVATSSHKLDVGSPMHNPFGRLKLVSMKDVAEGN